MNGLLERDRAALLVIDVQDRINAVMADQGHLPRIEVLVEACRGLEVPVLASEQYPQGLGPTVESLATILGETPPAKLTFSCARDDGLRKAVEGSGRKQIIVTGMNGVPPALFAVKRGAMDLTVSLNPVAWGILGINTMHAQLSGKKLGAKVFVGHVLVDKTNVDKFLARFKKKK